MYIYNLVRKTRFCYNLHKVRSKSNNWKDQYITSLWGQINRINYKHAHYVMYTIRRMLNQHDNILWSDQHLSSR